MDPDDTVSGHEARLPTFYDAVYTFVRRVPRGRVVTYGQVALELGSPAAARAVGYALHALPQGSDVPWWRVINAQGAISLKGRGPQADLQRSLLEDEGVGFDGHDRADLRILRWWPLDDGAGVSSQGGLANAGDPGPERPAP